LYLDTGNKIGGDCTKPAETINDGFVSRWNRMKKPYNRNVRAHSFRYCNVSLYLLNGVKIQIKLTKARQAFFLLSNKADSKVTFKFAEARLYLKRIRPNPAILAAHNETLIKGFPTRYIFTRVELKIFTFASGSRYLSIDNAVLGSSQNV